MPQAQATITTRLDPHDKQDFDNFCKNVGLNTSSVINLFVKTVLRERRIPFEITDPIDPYFTGANLNYIKKSMKELREGKGTVHELIEVNDD